MRVFIVRRKFPLAYDDLYVVVAENEYQACLKLINEVNASLNMRELEAKEVDISHPNYRFLGEIH